MGMHFGLIAARTTLDRLKGAYATVWPNHEFTLSATGFTSFEEIQNWEWTNRRPVPAPEWSMSNPGSEVSLLYQDGPWAVMTDSTYLCAGDEQAVAKLSSDLGQVFGLVVESAGGTASFCMCENGVLRRSLSYLDGETTRQGEPIPEEAAFEEDCFYMEEVELLMNSFGMTPYGDDSLAPRIVAWQVVDRTDYEKLRRERKSGPWWKFW